MSFCDCFVCLCAYFVSFLVVFSLFCGHFRSFCASDAKEQQFWISQLQACARRHSDSSAKVTQQPQTHSNTLTEM
uniref:PH domain-containing protein n=1 Tax=Acanthochromis polyacanthus TaxID=80966 RepID=A0A3Q1GMF0_9TELE